MAYNHAGQDVYTWQLPTRPIFLFLALMMSNHERWWYGDAVLFCLSPGGKLTLRKIAIWMSKNCQKLDIFSKKFIRIVIFFNKIGIGKKMTIFVNF